jgi:hypothetical protein
MMHLASKHSVFVLTKVVKITVQDDNFNTSNADDLDVIQTAVNLQSPVHPCLSNVRKTVSVTIVGFLKTNPAYKLLALALRVEANRPTAFYLLSAELLFILTQSNRMHHVRPADSYGQRVMGHGSCFTTLLSPSLLCNMFRPLLFCSIICLHRINLRNSEKY